MKQYPILIAALMMSSLSNVIAEPDHQFRAFLGITSVTSKTKIDAAAYYFEIFVFKGGKQVARLPTSATSDPSHREIEVSLMFNDKGTVKFISEGSTSDLSDRLEWLEILKPVGGKGFQTGTSDKPIGTIDGFKVLGMIQMEQLHSGAVSFKTQPDLEMDESIRRAIESAEGCVLIALKSGKEKEISKAWSDSVDKDIKRKKSEQATPRKSSD